MNRREFLTFGLGGVSAPDAASDPPTGAAVPPEGRAGAEEVPEELQDVVVPVVPPALVRLEGRRCAAWNGAPCRACIDRCPVPGAIRTLAGRPQIRADRCDGCGACLTACPPPWDALSRIDAHAD